MYPFIANNDLIASNKKFSDDLYEMLLVVEENNNYLDNLFFYKNNNENRVNILHALENRSKDINIDVVQKEMIRLEDNNGDFIRLNGNGYKTISDKDYRTILLKNADEIINRYRYTIKYQQRRLIDENNDYSWKIRSSGKIR